MSGIQVAVGYVMETALSLLLALVVIFTRHHKAGPRSRRAHDIFISGLRAFFDSAAYFALSIQLATLAVLARKDYGLGTADLGALETQIAQAISVVSLLPLLYPAALLEAAGPDDEEDDDEEEGEEHNARLLLLSLTVALSFYPFLSRCLHSFGQGMIGDGDGAVVSVGRWREVESLCFADGLDRLRGNGMYEALAGLELAASLVTYLFSFWPRAGLLLGQHCSGRDGDAAGGDGGRKGMGVLSARDRVNRWFSERPALAAAPLLVVVGLAAPMLWAIFDLRGLQKELADSTGVGYAGNEWGFGQIVSIVLFVPVGVAMVYRWRFGE